MDDFLLEGHAESLAHFVLEPGRELQDVPGRSPAQVDDEIAVPLVDGGVADALATRPGLVEEVSRRPPGAVGQAGVLEITARASCPPRGMFFLALGQSLLFYFAYGSFSNIGIIDSVFSLLIYSGIALSLWYPFRFFNTGNTTIAICFGGITNPNPLSF